MATIKLNAGSISKALLERGIKGLNKTLDTMETYAKKIAPTDTGKYINSFEKQQAKIEGNTVVARLVNSDQKASGVETGFRKRPVNWHKGPPRTEATRVYTGVGANVQLRASKFIENDLPRNIAEG